jgi:hypothetical protein
MGWAMLVKSNGLRFAIVIVLTFGSVGEMLAYRVWIRNAPTFGRSKDKRQWMI